MKTSFHFLRTVRYLIIMIIMTTVWILDIYIWLAKEHSCEPNLKFEALSLIRDSLNVCQGIIIFLMFVWRTKVKNAIFKRFIGVY